MSPLIIFLLLSQAPRSQNYVGQGPNFSLTQQRLYPYAPWTVKDRRRNADGLSGRTCFTMRSYIFSRRDGEAPVLVGTATCTPDEALRMDQVKNPPQVKLIPLD